MKCQIPRWFIVTLLLVFSPWVPALLFDLKTLPSSFFILSDEDDPHIIAEAIITQPGGKVCIAFFDTATGEQFSKTSSTESSFLKWLENQFQTQRFDHGLNPNDLLMALATLVFSEIPFKPPETDKDIRITTGPEISMAFRHPQTRGHKAKLKMSRCPEKYCRVRITISNSVTGEKRTYFIERPCISEAQLKKLKEKFSQLGFFLIEIDLDHNCYFEALLVNAQTQMTQQELRKRLWSLLKKLRSALDENPALASDVVIILGTGDQQTIIQHLDHFLANEQFIQGGHAHHWGDIAFTPFMALILQQPVHVHTHNLHSGEIINHPFGAHSWSQTPLLNQWLQQQGLIPPSADTHPIHILHDGIDHFQSLLPIPP
ncbi:MAG: hypothetical protein ACR2PX_03145 [Endozoicomonas sp.]|uniref:hypothetical protein n=1 Tax=Endozoicomonas sp. TaxID=1892382 RepID=UPI003D9B6216